MRALHVPRLHLRTDVLTATRRPLQRGAAFQEGDCPYQGTYPSTAAARESGAVGGGGSATEPQRAGMGGLLPLRVGIESARYGTALSVSDRSSLSLPPSQSNG